MYMYIFLFFSTARDTQESAHAHKKIGDSNPFFIDKKGIQIFVLRAHGIPANRRGLTEYGAARAIYIVAVLFGLTAGADENVRPPGQIGTRSRFIDDSFPPG